MANSLPPPDDAPKPQRPMKVPFKEHDWMTDWGSSDGSLTCKVCGVTRKSNLFLADKTSFKYHYTDAYDVSIASAEALPCPLFIGQLGGSLAETKIKVRDQNLRLGGVEADVESIESRLDRLERENAELRIQVEAKQEINLDVLTDWLKEMAASSRQGLPSVPVTVANLAYEVPRTIADVIEMSGIRVPVVIDVEAEIDPPKTSSNR